MSSILNNEDKIREAIQNSNSIKECLEYLGLRSAGGNSSAFKLACSKFALVPPTSYKLTQGKHLQILNTISLPEILVQNSSYTNRGMLKKRCFSEGLLRNICYSCGLKPEWNEKPLTLQLDHINGVHNDNRIENLAILCPNCHSQTETFCGRATKNYCTDCKTKIGKGSLRCRTCSAKANPTPPKIDWPSSEEVETLVNKLGYSGAGRVLGVTDNAVKKHLIRHPVKISCPTS